MADNTQPLCARQRPATVPQLRQGREGRKGGREGGREGGRNGNSYTVTSVNSVLLTFLLSRAGFCFTAGRR